jgi:hypothetical protein
MGLLNVPLLAEISSPLIREARAEIRKERIGVGSLDPDSAYFELRLWCRWNDTVNYVTLEFLHDSM